MNFKSIITFTFIIVLLSGCNSYKKMGYLKDIESLTPEQLAKASTGFDAKIMPGDLMTIYVNTVNPSVAVPFNLPLMPIQGDGLGGIYNTVGTQAYLIDNEGNIDFPVLGKLHLAGKTRQEVEVMIKTRVYPKYITEEPIVTTRFVSYRVSVLGEVNRPGVHTFPTDRVSIMEAIAMAGDLTIYGKRNNVLLMRENMDGTMQYIRLDLQDKNLALSPYFYLQQNDVIYVEPNKARGNSASIGATENLTISIVSILVSVVTLVVTIFK